MDVELITRVLKLRRSLRQHEGWTRSQLERHRQEAIQELRAFAYTKSPFYQRFHRGLFDLPLGDLPVLTKAELMEHFDELVIDRRIRLSDVEAHLATVAGDASYLDRHHVVATSGSTGRRGIFLSDPSEWATVVASCNRAGRGA